jgi:hypothetical protein
MIVHGPSEAGILSDGLKFSELAATMGPLSLA